MKNPENLYDAHIILGTSKTDKFIMSAVISKRFKNYMPSLVSNITVLPTGVGTSSRVWGPSQAIMQLPCYYVHLAHQTSPSLWASHYTKI